MSPNLPSQKSGFLVILPFYSSSCGYFHPEHNFCYYVLKLKSLKKSLISTGPYLDSKIPESPVLCEMGPMEIVFSVVDVKLHHPLQGLDEGFQGKGTKL